MTDSDFSDWEGFMTQVDTWEQDQSIVVDKCGNFECSVDDDQPCHSADVVEEQSRGRQQIRQPCYKTRSQFQRNKRIRSIPMCVLCKSKVKKMRNHLNQTRIHGELTTSDKKFVLSYYRTRDCKKVYHCSDCCLRFTNNRRHDRTHSIILIKDPQSFDQFPGHLKSQAERHSMTSTRAKDIVSSFIDHKVNLLLASGVNETSAKNKYSKYLRIFLENVFASSKNMKNAHVLSSIVNKYSKNSAYKPITIVLFLAHLTNFVKFVESYHKFHDFSVTRWFSIIREVKMGFNKKAQRMKKGEQDKMFAKVPSSSILSHVLMKSKAMLSNENAKLSFRVQKALNFLILQSRLNCRPGPLLSLEAKQFQTLQKNVPVVSKSHKTDYKYNVRIIVQKDQIIWIRKLLEKYEERYKKKPVLIFGNSKGEVDTGISTMINQTVRQYIPSAAGYDFSPTSIRKVWDSLIATTKNDIPTDIIQAHYEQTAHSEKTAQENYVKTSSKDNFIRLTEFYTKKLEGGINEEDGYLTNDETVETGSKALKKSKIVKASVVRTVEIEKPICSKKVRVNKTDQLPTKKKNARMNTVPVPEQCNVSSRALRVRKCKKNVRYNESDDDV